MIAFLKNWFVWLFLGGVAMAATLLPDSSLCTLREVTKSENNTFFSVWRVPDGTEVQQELTESEYLDLAKKGAGAPPNRSGDRNAVWVVAYEKVTYDTPSGNLEDCTYAKVADGIRVRVMDAEHDLFTVPLANEGARGITFDSLANTVRIKDGSVYRK